MRLFVILAMILLVVWTTAGTKVKDSLTLRVFNKDLSMSDAEMHELLKKANLESHGYKKEVVTTLTREPGSTVPDYAKAYYYYKVVPCDKVLEIEQELNRLLKGVLGSSVARRLKKDVTEKKIKSSGKLCKAGIEIHFKNQQSCLKKKGGRRVKRTDKPCCTGWFCTCGHCYKCTYCSKVEVL